VVRTVAKFQILLDVPSHCRLEIGQPRERFSRERPVQGFEVKALGRVGDGGCHQLRARGAVPVQPGEAGGKIRPAEGRGGRFEETTDGGLLYRASGREPRLWAGSRRGVPYHSKISAALRGEAPGELRFFTAEAVSALLERHTELDFRAHLWPLIAKEAGYGYYRELFTGSPERVSTTR
jgi:hypothetical protein